MRIGARYKVATYQVRRSIQNESFSSHNHNIGFCRTRRIQPKSKHSLTIGNRSSYGMIFPFYLLSQVTRIHQIAGAQSMHTNMTCCTEHMHFMRRSHEWLHAFLTMLLGGTASSCLYSTKLSSHIEFDRSAQRY